MVELYLHSPYVFMALCLIKVKLKGKVVTVLNYIMKAYRGVDVEIHIFLTSALAGGAVSTTLPLYHRGKSPRTHWIG
jgi:hypothetical protein